MPIAFPRNDGSMTRQWFSLLQRIVNSLNDATASPDETKAFPRAPVYDDATRPSFSSGDAGAMIFNSDDGTLNVWDGTQWTLSDGTAT